ncbi:T9SS type A sorting domain-containing protein [Moheibacter sediminis]|uniref:Por secretion system C-terminal sorting domain-containing protein n=1 Tax=Moheibacter sediminis TaxID=1434700 RepID=A0A1W2BQ89_9FLAO|nr:T9SS type A sorting domain-containing protein [Moheibacter sediminis]SMC74986.1 Por secretion system C-terminal sorting domain-containing protein [Moheibacter sediminis]
MRRLLFSFLLFSISIGNAQVIVYEQNFNEGVEPIDWTTEVEGLGTWIFDSDTTPGGVVPTNQVDSFDSLAAIFDDDSNGSGGGQSIATLLSPPISEAASMDIDTILEFEYACNFYPMDNGGRFYVEVFDGEEWVEILSATSMVQPTVFNLSVWDYAFENDDFQVHFVFDDEGNWSWGAGVNYFKLTQETLSVQELSNNTFSIYPNPVKDVAIIKSSQLVKQLSVYDLTGKQLVQKNNVSDINLSHLQTGIYLIKAVLADGAVITQKLVKK